jgi:acyl carrier protein
MRNLVSEHDAEVILQILMENLDVAREQITANAKLEDDLGVDSLGLVEITMAVEERLHLTVADEQAEKVKTVGDLFELVAELTAEQKK